MGKSALAPIEKVIIDKFRELSNDGKQRLVGYAELLYQNEKNLSETEQNDFFTEEERKSLEYMVKEVQEFSKKEITENAKKVFRELCEGIFETEEDIGSNHDFYLYGMPKRK